MNCKYQHKVNKNEIPVCNILGVNIAAINMDWLLDFTDKNIKDLSGDYMCVSNVHTTVTSYDDPDYCAVQNGSIMAIPDGEAPCLQLAVSVDLRIWREPRVRVIWEKS